MAGDKDIQTQDQTYQVQGYCAVVDDNMGCGYCVGNHQAYGMEQHFMTEKAKKQVNDNYNQRLENTKTIHNFAGIIALIKQIQ